MSEWKYCKDIRKLYKKESQFIIFAYYNNSYVRATAELVNMLLNEIHKDFPKVSSDNIYMHRLKKWPCQIALVFSLPKYEIKNSNLNFSEFKRIPLDLKEF